MSMGKRLFIDLESCRKCKECTVGCSYFYHPDNDGIRYLREIAEFAIACRHCDEAPCVTACPADALEKQENNIVKRYNLLCVACNTCSYACPFGTILPELITYFVSRCDLCEGRLKDKEEPVCVGACPKRAVQYGDFKPDKDKYWFEVSENLIVHSIPWKKEEYI